MKNNNSSIDHEKVQRLSIELLKAVNELTDDPYERMAVLRSAASNIEHVLASTMMRATVTAAIKNMMNVGGSQ